MQTLWRYAGPRFVVGAVVLALLGLAAIMSGLAEILSVFPRSVRPVVLIIVFVLCGVVAQKVRVRFKRRRADQLK